MCSSIDVVAVIRFIHLIISTVRFIALIRLLIQDIIDTFFTLYNNMIGGLNIGIATLLFIRSSKFIQFRLLRLVTATTTIVSGIYEFHQR